MKLYLKVAFAIWLLGVCGAGAATKTWDGQGGDASWGTPENWNANSLPAFDGTEVLSFGTGFVSGLTLTLDGDRSAAALYKASAVNLVFNPGTPATSKLFLEGGCLTNTSAAYSQTHNEEVVLGTSGTFNISSPTTAYQVNMNGTISESTPGCSLTKTGGRFLALNGSNTFSGGVILNEGGLILGHDQALGTGPFRITAAATVQASALRTVTNDLELATSATVLFANGSKGLTINAPGTVTLFANATLDLSLASASDFLTFNTGIQESGTNRSFRLLNSRFLVLNGTSTFSGTLTLGTSGGLLGYLYAGGTLATTNVVIYGGAVKLNTHNPLGAGKISVLGASGLTLETPTGVRKDLDNEIEWKGQVTGSGNDFGIDFNRNGGSSTLIGDLIFAMGQAGGTAKGPRFWNGLQESGGSWGVRIISGGATRYLVLGGTSTYSGPTIISRSILQVANANALPTNTAVSIAFNTVSDGVLDLDGKATRIGSLSGTGYVTLGGGTLTVGGSAATTYSGFITGAGGAAGAGGLTRDGSGVLRLASNTNLNYTGATRVQGGVLQVDGLLSAAAGTVEVSGGTLGGTGRINRAVNVVAGGAIQAGRGTNVLGTLTIGGTLGTSNGAAVVWAVNPLTNDLIAVNSLVQSGVTTLRVLNQDRVLLPSESYPVIQSAGSLTGFVPANWEIDLGESPTLTASRNARVYTNNGIVYLTGLQSPASPGTVISIR
jgi:fibronectin-binding autotransporter adhesin